jgi:hypothetical protein
LNRRPAHRAQINFRVAVTMLMIASVIHDREVDSTKRRNGSLSSDANRDPIDDMPFTAEPPCGAQRLSFLHAIGTGLPPLSVIALFLPVIDPRMPCSGVSVSPVPGAPCFITKY